MLDLRQWKFQTETSSLGDREDEPARPQTLREIAERGEIAAAVGCLADASGHPLRKDDPLAPLASDLARALTEAGLTLHHCVQHDPLYRLGGVCLMPVVQWEGAEGREGVALSWTSHDLLSRDGCRYGRVSGDSASHERGARPGARRTRVRGRPVRDRWCVACHGSPGGRFGGLPASGVDRAIWVSAAVAVLAVVGIAAYVPCWHTYEVVREHGEIGVTTRLEPATMDRAGVLLVDGCAVRGAAPCTCQPWIGGCWLSASWRRFEVTRHRRNRFNKAG